MENIKVTNEYLNGRIQLGVTLIVIVLFIYSMLNVFLATTYFYRLDTKLDRIEQSLKTEKPNETISL